MSNNTEFEVMRIVVALIALASLVALWYTHATDPMHDCGNAANKAGKTIHVYEAKYEVGNFMHGGDEEISYSKSYAGTSTNAFALPDVDGYAVNLLLPYVAASPYARTAYALDVAASPYANYLGRTSPSVEALWVQAPLNAPRRSTLSAFMSAGIRI